MKIEFENIFFLKKDLNIIKYKSVPIIPIDAKNPIFRCVEQKLSKGTVLYFFDEKIQTIIRLIH
jgi:hypothetical protein